MKITRKGFLLGSGAALLGLTMPKLSWSLSDFSIDAAALSTQDPYSPADILIFNKNNTGLQTTYGSGLRAQSNGAFGPFCVHDADYGNIIEAEITCPSSAASWNDPLFVVAMASAWRGTETRSSGDISKATNSHDCRIRIRSMRIRTH